MGKRPHILILGGTGFLGKSLNNYLNFSKEFKVTSISSKEIDLRQKSLSIQLINFYEENSTIIFLSAIKRNFGDSLDSFDQNMKIGMTIVDALQKKSVKNLIYLSSCAVYGEKNQQNNITETATINPTSFYGDSKVSLEILLRHMKNEGRINYLSILRPTTIFGDHKIPTYCPSGFVGKLLNENSIEIWGDGKEKRDFFYIENFIEVISFLLEEPRNITLNLASGISISFNQLLKRISFHLKGISIINKPRTNKIVDHHYNNQKLINLIPSLKNKNPLDWIDEFFLKKINN